MKLNHLIEVLNMYLDYTELQAERRVTMTIGDWANRLNDFLQFNEMEILEGAGKVTEVINSKIIWIKHDRLYKSDFDKLLEESEKCEWCISCLKN